MKLPGGLTGERALALAGVAGLMAVLLACVAMIAGVGGDDEEIVATPAQRTPTPTPTPTPEPTPKPLTASERAERETAAELVESRGFEVVRLRDYNPRQTLRILIGRQQGAPGGELAFFFVEERYIGNDATESSGDIRVRRRQGRRITLAYKTYEPGDRACCPGGETKQVRFVWDGNQLSPVDAVPPAQERSPAYYPQ